MTALTTFGVASLVASIVASRARDASLLLMWICLVLGVAFALAKQRPAGLLRVSSSDFIWGIALGLLVRLTQGVVSDSGDRPFPSAGSFELSKWLLNQFVPAGLIGPLVEEFFFRCLLLVAVYYAAGRIVGPVFASLAAIAASSGVFVAMHWIFTPIDASAGLQLLLLGVVCSVVVFSTGRIWPAVLVHCTYNATFLGLALVGSLLA